MTILLNRVKSRLFIASSRLSSAPLAGNYASLLHGRSLDFDDLHRYEHGDDIRDIDWRATARLGTPLVRRSRAERAHTVLFAIDTGRGMAAKAPDGAAKRDLSVLACGVLGFLALRHSDQIGVIYGDAAQVHRTPVRRSEGALEMALRKVRDAVRASGAANDRQAVLSTVTRTIAKRCLLVVITDAQELDQQTQKLLRRLRVQHDVLWVTIADADPFNAQFTADGKTVTDVDTAWRLPRFLSNDAQLREQLQQRDTMERQNRQQLLTQLGLSHVELTAQASAVGALLQMLEKRSRVRR